MTNKTRQIIVVVSVFVLAIASLGTIIGLLVNTGQMSEYSNGFRYQLNGSRATIISYDGSDSDVVIPDKIRGKRVVAIDKDAFKDKSAAVKSIKFNCKSSAFTIATEAFTELSALEKVVLPKNIKEVADGAFRGCKALKIVIMPNSVTKIGESAFRDCSSLKFVYNTDDYSTEGDGAVEEDGVFLPTSLLELGSRAFENCTAIVDVNMSKDLEKIGSYAFYGCSKFSNLDVAEDIEVANIDEWAFYNTSVRSSASSPLNFPNLVNIGASAFKNVRSEFVYFALPKSVKNIGDNAFAESAGLSKFVMDKDIKLESMGAGVFEGCTQLTDVALPTEIKFIPARTFKGCYKLLYNNDFEIGEFVETVGEGAFAIYTGSSTASASTYSRKALKVHPGNENFVITELEKNKRESSANDDNPSTYSQGLLTSADGSVVYAYYGTYDANSLNSLGKTFRFLDADGNFLTSVTTIKAYAFAGVDFEYIQLPTTIKEVGDYVFFGSKVIVCYTSAIDWELTQTSFNRVIDPKDDDNTTSEKLSDKIEVGLLSTLVGAEDFIQKLGADYGINAMRYSAALLP